MSFAFAILNFLPEAEQNLVEISEVVQEGDLEVTSAMPRIPEHEDALSEGSRSDSSLQSGYVCRSSQG